MWGSLQNNVEVIGDVKEGLMTVSSRLDSLDSILREIRHIKKAIGIK